MRHGSEPIIIRLHKPLRRAVEAGHPWIYAGACRALPQAPAGTIVQVVDTHGFLAWGVYDPDHPIAVRVWSRDQAIPPDAALVRIRLARALRLRERVVDHGQVEAMRVLHGAADGTPGWALDRYGNLWVVRSDGDAAAARVSLLVSALHALVPWDACAAVVHRRSRGDGVGPSVELLHGSWPAQPPRLREYAWVMEADVRRGQKTGWFLDQREQRRWIHTIAADLRVLNLFAYTGGFGLAAATGGATVVTNVDVGRDAIAAAERNARHNGVEARTQCVCADAFDWLSAQPARAYDLIVVDPPSFAPNARSVANALRAYRKLAHGAMRAAADEAVICLASCSSHICRDDILSVLSAAGARAGRPLRLLRETGAAPDHPVLPAFPEGRYLDFVAVAVD